ncbi:hypothetical protein PPERSA_02325 [Pseudocohnilembus persalinus]|uniref:Pyrroline-5-carboxylate reductase catalytic N-terminal domain-containing protein n=1 Tax=Pseudocohnilembus persalinus TaxID=266149 RepID=A0A0V0QU94_PSEPJ|nr:hypothetical protein PPERSA_02325 [Pseudocohnilembus persalinus]|eukprot:KRX05793.1 hypothetical protein PPERSA_02325 [Pseudocohnilembus persalinus]
MVRKVLQKTVSKKVQAIKSKAPKTKNIKKQDDQQQKRVKSVRQQQKQAKKAMDEKKEKKNAENTKKTQKKVQNKKEVKQIKSKQTSAQKEKKVSAAKSQKQQKENNNNNKNKNKVTKQKKSGKAYQNVTIGIIGIGTITKAMVEGLCNARVNQEDKPKSLILSPRGEENSKKLAKQYPDIVKRVQSNQEVVDKSDWIVIGLRVPQVLETIPQLKFKNGQKIINLAAMPNDTFQTCIKTPKIKVTVIRACPLPSMALNVGAPILQPYDKEITELFGVVGHPFPVKTSQEIYSLQGLACLMGPQYGILQTCYDWLVKEQKIDAKTAKEFTMEMFNSIIIDAQHKVLNKGFTFQSMIDEQVKGGLNEANHQYAEKKQVYKQFNNILKATYQKMITKK